MSIFHSHDGSVLSASSKSGLLNAAKRSISERRQDPRLTRRFRVLSFALAVAALSPTAHAASGIWTNGDANNVWQDNLNWSATPFPGGTTAAFTSTDTATFSTTGSGTITLGGTGLINVQTIFFGTGGGDASAFTLGASTDVFDITPGTSGGVIINTGVTHAEQVGVAGTTINLTNGGNNNITNNGTGLLTIGGNFVGNAASGQQAVLIIGGTGNTIVTGNISSATAGTVLFVRDGTTFDTLTLSGTTTTNNGQFLARSGVTNINGAVNTGTALFEVAGSNTTARDSTVNIAANVTTNNMNIGNSQSSTAQGQRTGAVYQTAGTVSITQAAGPTDFQVGLAPATTTVGSGYYNLAGGSLTANQFDIGAVDTNNTSTNATVGVMEVTGGIATTNGSLNIGHGSGISSGTVNVFGGTLNTGAMAATGPIALNYGTNSGAQAVLNVGGGTGAAAVTGGAGTTATGPSAGLGLNLAASNTAGTQGVVNLLTNGTLTVTDVVAQGTATSHLNFNGGTLKATATNLGANFITSTNISAINVYSGGGTIDNSGTNITIGHAIVAPIGQGVSATTVSMPSGGSGYINAPLVKLTGGTGTGATGYATISGGKVTGITITSPGIGYTAGDLLTATLYGGLSSAGTAATNVTGIAVAANTSGGMTFAGSGTTTLSGANTYTGATNVSAGTLLVNGSTAAGSAVAVNGSILGGTGTAAGPVTVNAGGKINPGPTGTAGSTAAVGMLSVGALTLSSSTSGLAFDLNATASYDKLVSSGAVNLALGTFTATVGTGTFNNGDVLTLISGTSLTPFNAYAQGAVVASNGTFNFTADYTTTANAFDLDVVAVPEPSAWVGSLLGMVLTRFALRRRVGALRRAA